MDRHRTYRYDAPTDTWTPAGAHDTFAAAKRAIGSTRSGVVITSVGCDRAFLMYQRPYWMHRDKIREVESIDPEIAGFTI